MSQGESASRRESGRETSSSRGSSSRGSSSKGSSSKGSSSKGSSSKGSSSKGSSSKGSSGKGSSGWFWPLFLIGLLASNVIGVVFLVLFALDDPSHHIEKDYYKKAVNYDQEMAQQRQNLRLGWKLRIDFERPSGERMAFLKKHHMIPETVLTAFVVDRAGKPLPALKVAVEAFPFRRAGRRVKRELKADEAKGSYRATIKLIPSGRWRFMFSLKKGKDTFTTNVDTDVPSPLSMVAQSPTAERRS